MCQLIQQVPTQWRKLGREAQDATSEWAAIAGGGEGKLEHL